MPRPRSPPGRIRVVAAALLHRHVRLRGAARVASSRREARAEEDAAPYQAEVDEGLGAAVAILIDTSGSMREKAAGDSRPKYVVAQEAIEAMLDATDAFVAKRPDFPDQDRHLQFLEQRADAAADPALRSRRDPAGARRRCRVRAAARRSARRCARPGPTSIAPASSASICWSSPTATTPAAADPDDVAREIFSKSQGAVQVYFVAFDTSPAEVRVPEGGRRRRDRRRHRRGAAHRRSTASTRARSSPRRPTPANGNRPGSSLVDHAKEPCDSSQVLVGLRRADQQGREPVLGGRSGRADALRIRPRGRAAQGRPRRARAVPRPGRARHAPGRRRTASHVQKLEAETKAYLKAGDRATAVEVRARAAEGQGGARHQRGPARRCTKRPTATT